jgi:hypothetical protein
VEGRSTTQCPCEKKYGQRYPWRRHSRVLLIGVGAVGELTSSHQ